VERERVQAEFQACRAAVFPSYAEAFSMVPLEAMAQGCPVIYSNRHSGPELIDHGRNGLLVDPDRSDEIAAAIVRLLRDGAEAARLGAAGRDDVARLWFAKTGGLYRVLRGHTRPITAVAFSADGRLVATASADADARVWSVRKGTHHLLQRSAFGPISAIAFDSSGRWVAGAAPVNAIVWAAGSGRQLFTVRGHTALLTGVSFAPRGPTLLSSSTDGTIRTYRCQVCVGLSGLVHLAEVRLAQTR
jgi:hypothetical protein